MSIKNFLLNNKSTYKLYLYYNLYIKNFYKKKTGYYSQWGEDRYISEFFKNKKKGFYFDIGCYHPIKYSNTCLLYKNGWSGVNIDANRTSIDLFNIARPKDNNICAAISDNNNLTEYFVDNIMGPVNTLDRETYEKFKSVFFKNMHVRKIKTLKLEDIEEHNLLIKKTDFLNIDIEGLDFKVLKQINLRNSNISLVGIETHLPNGSKTQDSDDIFRYLKDHSFTIFKRVIATTLFKRE